MAQYETAIKNLTALFIIVLTKAWAHLGSNQGPTGYEPVALPTELWAHRELRSNSFTRSFCQRGIFRIRFEFPIYAT